MQSGKLRHRITLERASESKDEWGEITKTWTEFGKRWSRAVPLSGKESFSEAHEIATIDLRVELRHDSLTETITAKDRVVWDGNTYDIETPIDVSGLGKEIHLMCVKSDG